MHFIFKLLVLTGICIAPNSVKAHKNWSVRFFGQQDPKFQSDSTIFLVVEKPPEFPGGRTALFQFVASKSNFPVSPARSEGGKSLYLKLVIERNGSISKTEIIKSDANQAQNEEALRIVREMPVWKPGVQSGRAVRVYSIFAIHFR